VPIWRQRTTSLRIAAPLRIVTEPIASGRKWRAFFDDECVCISAWPFVIAARQLLAAGYPADSIIQMWRPGATERTTPANQAGGTGEGRGAT
jgi:hypothetical protein